MLKVMNGILFIYEKERNPAIFDNMDGSWEHYIKWGKLEKKNTISYHLYVKFRKARGEC